LCVPLASSAPPLRRSWRRDRTGPATLDFVSSAVSLSGQGAQPSVPRQIRRVSESRFREGKLGFRGELKCLGEKRTFFEWVARVRETEWVVYAKPPFGGPRQVLKYLARYTHRVAISNQRLISLEDGRVTFRWKNYARASAPATMTLKAEEFIRRFLLHVLPKGFVKIRHFGFLANRCRRENVLLCRELLAASSTGPSGLARHDSHSDEPEADRAERCPRCKVGSMRPAEILLPQMFTTAALSSSPQMDTS
jgi:putative transposase